MSELRQAESVISIVGKLKEKNLEIGEAKREGKMATVIKGDVIISTGGDSEHRIRVFTYATTKEGKDNPSFVNLKTVMTDFVSEADALQKGLTKADADVVEIRGGSLGVNEFYAQSGQLVTAPQLGASFIQRAKDPSQELKAEFKTEVFFTSIKPEVKQGEETGRTIIKALLVEYNGKTSPIEFVAEGATGGYLQDNYLPNRTGRIWGKIVNSVKVTRKEIAGFGESRIEEDKSYINELLITGGEQEQYDNDDEKKAYNKASIEKALVERDLKLEEMKNKAKSGGQNINKPVDKANNTKDIPF